MNDLSFLICNMLNKAMLSLVGHIFSFLWPFKRKYAKQTKYFWCYFFFFVIFVKNCLQMESEVNILSERGLEHLLWTCRIGGWAAIKESGVVRDG